MRRPLFALHRNTVLGRVVNKSKSGRTETGSGSGTRKSIAFVSTIRILFIPFALACAALGSLPVIANAAVTTTSTLSGGANAVTGNVGLSVEIDACPPSNAPNASGTVQFFEGATPVGSYTLTNFLPPPPSTNPCGGPFMYQFALLTLPAVSPGSHTYSAVYSGDAYYAPSTSASVPINVTALPPVPPGQSYSGPASTQTGTAILQLSGGGPLCGFTRGAFFPVAGDPRSPPPNSAPPGLTFPHGLIGFVTSGCTPGATQTFTLTLPGGAVAPNEYWKYGPTPDNATPHWYRIPATIAGNVVTFAIADGGLGDD